MRTLHILHLEDNPDDSLLIAHKLKMSNLGCTIKLVSSAEEFRAAIQNPHDFKVILSDYNIPSFSGLEALKEVRQLNKDMPFICVSGTIGEDKAIELLHQGATDYVLKDRLDRLPEAIKRAVDETDLRSAREASEAALRRSEAQFNFAFDHAPIGMGMMSLDGRFIRVNDAYCQITCRRRDQMLGSFIDDITHPEYREQNQEATRRLIQNNERVFQTEMRILMPNCSTKWVLANFTRVDDETGKPVHFFKQVVDVTERKEMEQTLERRVNERTEALRNALEETERAREGLDTVFRSISDGLIVTDADGRVAMINNPIQQWFNVDLSAIGKPAEAAFPQIALRDSLCVAMCEGRPVRFDHVLENTHGRQRKITLACCVAPMIGRNGVPHGAVTAVEDITHLKEAERVKDDFISFAAHELRTPLTSIRGYAELLVSRELTEDRRKTFLTTLHRQAVHLANLVNDLLDLARLQQGNAPPLKRQPVDVALIARELIDAFKDLGGPYTFATEAVPDPFPVHCDGQKIQQILQNLLSNARKYSIGGTILVRLSRSGAEKQNALLEVIDEGIGMTREQIAHVFDRFYRADSSNTRATGTGLGMSIVKAIVEQHGGTVRVESEVKKGTRVIIELPRAVRERSSAIVRAMELKEDPTQ